MLGAVKAEVAVIRLVGAGILGCAFWLFDAGGAGLNAAGNATAAVAAAVAADGRGRFFSCVSCRNTVASSSGTSTPLMKMLIGSTGVVVVLEVLDMVAMEADEFIGR